MTREERENAIRCLKLWIEKEPYIQTYKTCLEALEQKPCENAISRQAVMDALCNDCELFRNGEQTCFTKCEEYHFLATLPPVTPQPKTGHWIIIDDCEKFIAKCSECGRIEDSRMISKYPYCHCGAKMD